MKRPLIAALLASPLLSCATAPAQEFPCYDGWNTDSSGASVLWEPGEDELQRIRQAVPDGAPVACIHRMPSGRVLALYPLEGRRRFLSLVPHDGGYEVVERGFIVGGQR